MKKFIGLIAAIAAVTALGAVISVAGCQNSHPQHTHVFGPYESVGEEGHRRPAVCQGHEGIYSDLEPHDYGINGGNICIVCGYEKEENPSETEDNELTNADGLIIEGITENEINLDKERPSHSINGSALNFYLGYGGQKLKKLENDSVNLSLKNAAGVEVEDWTNLRGDGKYTLTAVYYNGDVSLKGSKNIIINNPVLPDTLSVKEGAKLSQPKSRNDYMSGSWQYEISRMNGDKENVNAESVTVEGLNTYAVSDNSVAILKCGGYSGSVSYCITENANLHTRDYGFNFDSFAGDVDGKELLNDGYVEITVSDGAVLHSELETVDKYFQSYLILNGALNIRVDGEAVIEYYHSDAFLSAAGAQAEADEAVSYGKSRQGDDLPVCSKLYLPRAGTYELKTDGERTAKIFCIKISLEIEDENAEDLTLPNDNERLIKLSASANSDDYVQIFNSGDTFEFSGEIALTGTYIRGNLGDKQVKSVSDGLKYYIFGEEVISGETVLTAERFHDFGKTEVVIKCGQVCAAYGAELRRPPVEGAEKLKLKPDESFDYNVFSAEDSLHISPELFRVEAAGIDNVSELLISELVCRREGSTALMTIDENGLNIGVGEYEVTASVKIVQGYAEGVYEVACTITVGIDSALKNVCVGTDELLNLGSGEIKNDTQIHYERSGSVEVTATGNNSVKIEECEEVYFEKTFLRCINLCGGGRASYRSLKISAKGQCLITLYIKGADYGEITFTDAYGNSAYNDIDGECINEIQFLVDTAGDFYLYCEQNMSVFVYEVFIDYST